MKHIKVKAEYIRKNRRVKITLLEQTHVNREFGRSIDSLGGACHGQAFVHKDVALYSLFDNADEIYYNDGRQNSTRKLYFHLGRAIGRSVNIKVNEWALLKEAIEAYNKWGATQ